MDDDGDFVVAWANPAPGSDYGIFAQRFNASGVKQGGEFRVNTFTGSAPRDTAIAMDADGDFVVAWTTDSLFSIEARRYNAAGVAQGDQFTVAQSGVDYVTTAPSVAMDADGDFVVGWRNLTFGFYTDPPDQILFRRYNAAGVPRGPESVVDSAPGLGDEDGPSLAMDDDGDFVISWTSYDGNSTGISAWRFSAAGFPQGTQFLVNTYTTDVQWLPVVAMDASGDFVITWASLGQDGWGWGVYAQRFNAAGLRQGSEFRVNSFTTDYQQYPVVAIDADGGFVVAWESFGQDGSLHGIYAQRYAVSQRPAITSSQFVWQNAPQRLEFTFDQDVSASLSLADIIVQDLTNGATVTPSGLSYDSTSNTATITFAGILADADYRATVAAAGVSNAAGTTLAVDYALEFFFLQADANHDRRVGLQDFNILAANFGLASGATFARGDFNYDGQTNLADFNILVSRFGNMLGPGASLAGTSFSPIPIEPTRPPGVVGLLDDLL